MSQQFPVFKLMTQLARQASSPIATRIKEYARSHPGALGVLCIRLAQTAHIVDLRVRLWVLAARQPRSVPPLSTNRALEQGADLLGEVVIFILGAIIVTFEVNRQALKQLDKKLIEKSKWVAISLQLEELQLEVIKQQNDLDKMHETLREIYKARAPPPVPPPAHDPPRAPPQRPPRPRIPIPHNLTRRGIF